MTEVPELWTPEQTAAYLHTTPATLNVQRSQRKGPPYVKVGAKVLYRAEDVVAYVNAGLVQR